MALFNLDLSAYEIASFAFLLVSNSENNLRRKFTVTRLSLTVQKYLWYMYMYKTLS